MKKRLAALGLVTLLALYPLAFGQTATPATDDQPKLSSNASGPALPAGTTVKMKLETPVSTATSKAGDTFSGRVTEDVFYGGKKVIPVGSTIQGWVAKTSEPRRIKGRPSLEMRPESITLPNGDKMLFIAVLVKTDDASHTKVNSEGKVIGPGINRTDKLQMAGGAAGGALIGGLAAQSMKGAVIGSVIGGGVAAIYWLTKKKSATLDAGTEIVMELNRPMAFTNIGD